MTFSNFGGGLVNTIVAGAGNNISTSLANQLNSNIQFSVGSVLAGAVQETSGYALDAGQNYLLSQIGGSLSSNVNNDLANAVVTQVASVGLNAARSFASQTISNVLSGAPAFSGIGGALEGIIGGLAGGGAGGFIGLHAQDLPEANYGTNRFTTQDIVFSIVPSNAGPQTQAQPQSSPTLPLNYAFDPSFQAKIPGLDSLKGKLSTAGPGSGIDFSGSYLGGAGASSAVSYSSLSSIKPVW